MDNRNYSKGISWIDDCRIPFVDGDGYTDEEWKNLYAGNRKDSNTNLGNEIKNIVRELLPKAPQGRFPANILVSDDMLNDGSISSQGNLKLHKISGWGLQETKKNYVDFKGDKGTNSRYYDIDKWFDNLIDV